MPPRLLHAAHITERRQPDRTEIHRHPWHELVLVLGGRYLALGPDGPVSLAAGACVHWPAGVEHRPQAASRPPALLVLQYREAGPAPARRPRVVAVPPPGLHTDAQRLLLLADRREPRLRRVVDALLDLVLWQLETGEAGEPPLLRRLRTLVAGRIFERWPLARLAAELGSSPRHLHRRLHAECGLTPRAAVTALRVERALPLLTEDDLTLDAVARRVGIGSRQHLARLVRARTGRPPALLRRPARRAH